MTKHPKPQRYLITTEQYRLLRRVLQQRNIWFLAGIGSISVPSRNEKYIISHTPKGRSIVAEWPDLDGEMLWMSPGEAARTELKREFPTLRRVGWTREHTKLFDWRWPMAYLGRWEGDGVYIDLKGAYHQIYRKLWLDTCFPRGRGQLPLRYIACRLEKWKQARNSLIGIVRSRKCYGFRGGKSIPLHPVNPFLSPGLWATVQAILNEIAWQAIKSGAIYVATDGYIMPLSQKQKSFARWLEDTGFVFREIPGEFSIVGWGAYRGPHKTTMNYAARDYVGNRQIRAIKLPFEEHPTKITEWWKGIRDD